MIVVNFHDVHTLLDSVKIAVPVLLNESEWSEELEAKSLWIRTNFKEEFKGLIPLLDGGVDVVVINFKAIQQYPMSVIEEGLADIPSDRLAIEFEPDLTKPSVGPNFRALSELVDHFIICNPPSAEVMVNLQLNFADAQFIVYSTNQGDELLNLEKGFNVMVDASFLSIGKHDKSKIDLVDLLMFNSKSDRSDGLFPTMVVDEQGIGLGICYSSHESIAKALETKTGVYFSRSRGLWYKGKTSGASQILHAIDLDCDADTLRFTVTQTDPGFCHLNTRTCFGKDKGISSLVRLLQSRMVEAPEKSYTRRLFNDTNLLKSKLLEEAGELCEATSIEDVAWEAADLLYFALVKCISAGVTLSDIEKNLDGKSKKITRRPGNAKTPVVEPKFESTTTSVPPFNMVVHEVDSQSNENLLLRPIINTKEIMDRVKPIVQGVKEKGDVALKEFTCKFDGVEQDSVVLKAPFPAELMQISENVKRSIDLAYENVEKFHVAQLDKPLVVETMPGVICSRFARPIEKVGLYVPGGTAVLPSSTLMLGVPAKVAGCKEIVIATPPRKDGSIAPEVVYVAHKVGANLIVKAGGAQAVAAMAYGTETVPKVDKICGPGNQYVTAAKMVAQSDSSALLSIDMPAGPSELLVIADSSADPRYVVSDLLSQAEHGVDSQVVLLAVGFTENHINEFQVELKRQALALPRSDIVRVSLSKSFILKVDTVDEALAFSNKYAPEHLILNINNPSSLLEKITNAGSVFVGPYSPESCGDYASGTNHTLPTYGYARMYSGVNTATFMKYITSQELTKEGLNAIGDAVVTLAEVEGLDAHRNAVAIRLSDIRGETS